MGVVFVLLAIVAIAGVTAAVVFFANLARQSKKDYDASNQTVSGRRPSVPASWAGSHDAAALLHRRLVAAMAALRANQAFDDDGGLIDLRVELERQSEAIDQRLVAVAALPATVRAEPLRQVTEATAALEAAVGDLASRSVEDLRPNLESTLADLRQRSGVLDQIRRQLDATDPATESELDAPVASDPVAEAVAGTAEGGPDEAATAPGTGAPELAPTTDPGPDGGTAQPG